MQLDQRVSKSAPAGTLVSLKGERERMPSRRLDGIKEVAVFQTAGISKIYI